MSTDTKQWPRPVRLERYEVQELIQWHREQQYEAASRREDYASAADHKRRADELALMLKEAS